MHEISPEQIALVALENSGIGFFQIILATGEMKYSRNYSIILTGSEKTGFTSPDFLRYLHDDDKLIREAAYKAASETGKLQYEARSVWDDGSVHWMQIRGTFLNDENGKRVILTGTLDDVTVEHENKEALTSRELIFRKVTNSSPAGLWLCDETGAVTYLNNRMLEWTGLTMSKMKGAGWLNVIAEQDREKSFRTYSECIAARIHFDNTFRMVHSDGTERWCRAAGDPFFTEDGRFAGYAGFCLDINEMVTISRELQAGEEKFRSIIEHAPFPTALYIGRELIIETANAEMISLWGKDSRVLNMPLHEALPELEGQDLLEILDEVYTTGNSYHAQEAKVSLIVNNIFQPFYFTFTYKPIVDPSGNVYGIINMAIDVTEQVLHRQKIEVAELNLRTAVELAQLGTWSIELATNEISYSERIRDWFGIGYSEKIDIESAYRPVIEPDKARLKAFFQKIAANKDGEVTNIEFSISPGQGLKNRVIHSQGRCFYDDQGRPVRITGASQDVTTQRMIQVALEQQVQERTEELQSVNEELTATNEELFDSNQRLTYSNEELAQYAYVASHDLQEPLRKIRMFSDMLHKKIEPGTDNKELVDKINRSAERMTQLIENLLDFSRLLKSDMLLNPVDLNQVVQEVKNDFELVIQETGATINIGRLEVIEAIGLQMNQLFYNLVSNSLKFTRPDVKPVIEISGEKLKAIDLKDLVSGPLHYDFYYRIKVRDNGIGFEDQYADQIFEVFKRLHRREIYPGSGIGLALCRRIVTNHNGYIYTESAIQKGTTFHILLPMKGVIKDDPVI